MIDRESATLSVVVAAVALLLFVAALRWRSWPLWLLAYAVTVASLAVAWTHRPASVTGAASWRAPSVTP
ncbi:MAG: hypothetical protein IT353_01505 [Gemmatimonadaceae bacterium]|nr:hypothetical protein [Gemmatimonadaceae bacterium]